MNQAIEAVIRQEPMGRDAALVMLALRSLLAAIGSDPHYRQRYIAKGGTVLRLRTDAPLERVSTDLDFSSIGLELQRQTDTDHIVFATEIGTRATNILRGTYDQDAADIVVRFLGGPEPHEDGENPDTAVYRIQVEAQLNGKRIQAKSQGYKIDVTADEDVDESQVEDLVLTTFGINIDVRAYTAVQSISEKLRALLQKRRHFERNQNAGNWVPRHLFDLVPLRRLAINAHLEVLPDLFRRKCAVRQLAIDVTTRGWLLDTRLLEKACGQHRQLAMRSWQILEELVELLKLP